MQLEDVWSQSRHDMRKSRQTTLNGQKTAKEHQPLLKYWILTNFNELNKISKKITILEYVVQQESSERFHTPLLADGTAACKYCWDSRSHCSVRRIN